MSNPAKVNEFLDNQNGSYTALNTDEIVSVTVFGQKFSDNLSDIIFCLS